MLACLCWNNWGLAIPNPSPVALGQEAEMHWQVNPSGCKEASIVSVLWCEQRHSVSAAALGWCLSGVGETETVSQSWHAGGHFCQSPLDKFLLLLSALAVGKKHFSCTSLDRKLAKQTQQCLSSIEAAEIQGRCQGAGERKQQPPACPAGTEFPALSHQT